LNTPSDAARPRIAAKARLKWDPTREKHLLLYPEGLLVLNPTAHAVLEMCDGQRAVTDIVKTLGERYNADVRADVNELLSNLSDKGLVAWKDEG
jgi:pyrroloquinoline quinone biosynthesis protein D